MSSWQTRPSADLDVCVGVALLAPGDAEGMRAVAVRLERVAAGASAVAGLLGRVDAGEWVGESGTAFREAAGAVPAPYALAGEVLAECARALSDVAGSIERAREVAGAAVLRMDEALWAGDPETVRAQARRSLAGAQEQVALAVARAERVLGSGAQAAPRRDEWASLGRGAVDAVTGTASLGWGLVTDPVETTTGIGSGLLDAVTNPLETLQEAGSAFAEDPSYALGAALPGVLLALLGGAGALTRLPAPAPPARSVSPEPIGPLLTLEVPGPEPRRFEVAPQLMHSAPWAAAEALKIATGHAWQKHKIDEGHFTWLSTQAELAAYLASVINAPSASHEGLRGRSFYWDDVRQVVIIVDGRHEGTAFQPSNGKRKYDRYVAQDLVERGNE